MNIAIDARLLEGKITGISRYLWNILKFLPQFDKQNKYFLFAYSKLNDNNFYKYIFVPKTKLPKQIYSHYWLNFILPTQLKRYNIHIFFTPYILVPLKRGGQKNIIVIHDSMPKAFKEYYTWYYRKYMDIILPPAIKRSDLILTVSKSARQDIINYHKVDSEKIKYVHLWTDEKYHPYNLTLEEKKIIQKKYNLPEKFILYVGAIEERKNISGIIKISDSLTAKGFNIKFVLVGNPGYGFNKLYPEIKRRKKNIQLLNYVDEHDLPFIYNLAFLFLFPTFYEGFGLPPLEAMKCGLPLLASDNSSLKEVVGEGGLVNNATDYNSFIKNIILLLTDNEFYSKYKLKALEQAKKFTPENQMPQIVKIFNNFK
jgi:glycosyltransferase involved in cell wall biosynthesis